MKKYMRKTLTDGKTNLKIVYLTSLLSYQIRLLHVTVMYVENKTDTYCIVIIADIRQIQAAFQFYYF